MTIAVDISLRGSRLGEVTDAARVAEDVGYSGVWCAEAGSRNPFLRLAIVATQTRRLQFGTGIALAFPRAPMLLATTAWDLADQSDGRFILGLGSQVKGHMERRFSIPWTAPGPRMRDYIGCLRAIFHSWQYGTPADFRSEHYQYTLITPSSRREPLRAPFRNWAGEPVGVPIYLAAVNPYMCRLAGRLCEGIFVHPLHSQKYLTELVLPELRQGADLTGRPLQSVAICVQPFVVTGHTDEEFRHWTAVVKRQIAYYASTRTYARILDLHGWGDVPGRLHELTMTDRWDEIGAVITDDMLEVFAVVGRPEEIPAKLKARYDGVASRLRLYHPDVPVEQRALLDILQDGPRAASGDRVAARGGT
jgi:probable F420-dependent oxidoreductase